MKKYYKVLGSTIIAIVAFWLVDAKVDSFFHYDESFLDSLLFNDKERAMRILATFFFLAFGFILARIFHKQQTAEHKYRELFESATDGIFILDLEGNFIDINTAAYTRLGYTKDEMLSLHIAQLDPPDFAAMVPDRLARIQEEGAAVFESAHMRKDGTVMPVEVNCRLMEHDGRKVYFSIVRDITERKRAEELLSDSEQRFRASFENAAVGASMANLKGQFTKVNRFLCHMLGYPEDELLSKTFSEVTHPDDVQIGLNAMKRMLSGELNYTSFEKRYIRKDGQMINVVISPAIIRGNDGTPLYFVALFQDITERKRAMEQIRAALEEKDVLLREVHHRVKNNMQLILSLIKLQLQFVEDEKAVQQFFECQNRIRSMAFVHQHLYMSENLAKIDFKHYLQALIRGLKRSFGNLADDVRVSVDVDNVSLNTDTAIPCGLIINELVSNSIEHAFPEGSRGEVGITVNRDANGDIEMAVADNGIGLPEGFDFRNNSSLGMDLVVLLAENQLGGKIEISTINGTEFRIKFKEVKYPKRM